MIKFEQFGSVLFLIEKVTPFKHFELVWIAVWFGFTKLMNTRVDQITSFSRFSHNKNKSLMIVD